MDRLMKQISNFISEISDDFKIVVVDAIKVSCWSKKTDRERERECVCGAESRRRRKVWCMTE